MRSYFVDWSEEDGEWVATCSDEPYLSWLAASPVLALTGLENVLENVLHEKEGDEQGGGA